jgi:hypothetical protein
MSDKSTITVKDVGELGKVIYQLEMQGILFDCTMECGAWVIRLR